MCHGLSCVDDQSARGVKYKLNFSGNLYRRTSHRVFGKLLFHCFVFCFFFTSDYTLRVSQLRRSWFSSVSVLFVCLSVFVFVRPRERICGSAPWKRYVPSSLSFPLHCFQFLPLLLHGVRYSLSLWRNTIRIIKKIINANLPYSPFFLFLLFAVLFYTVVAVTVCVCYISYSRLTVFLLAALFKRSLFKFFFVFFN